ncbi:MAG: hypothetical protein M3Q97_05015 [Bacteroidota bacterium]|nr:hypothetical protein [Bacteroidota bacterium]
MLKKLKIKIAIFMVAIACMISVQFAFTTKQESTQVMLYGYVYGTMCNTEVVDNWQTRLVSAENYSESANEMENELMADNPGANVRVGSSRYDYGPSADHMCLIQWQSGSKDCKYWVFSISFGQTQEEALNKAMSKKNEWANADAQYNIVSQKYW